MSSGKPSLKAPDKNRSVSMQKEKENINPSSWQVGVKNSQNTAHRAMEQLGKTNFSPTNQP